MAQNLETKSGPRPAGRIAVLVYFSPPPAADKVISTISLGTAPRTVKCDGGIARPSGNGPVDKRSAASGTAVITLFSRRISHQSPRTGFGIRRFDAL
jgi:hypothetical protein